ncbi:MAG: rod shape-determining protein MreD [Phocaeicola sp.]
MVQFLQKIMWFIVVLLLQALILNNVHIEGYATPYLFIYFILKQPSNIGRNSLMIWAFLLGLGVDMFSDTPGIHTAALTLLAFLRPSLLRLWEQREDNEVFVPSSLTMGTWVYMRYNLISTLLFTTVLLCIDTFSFVNWQWLLLRIGTGILSTLVCIYCAESINKNMK